VKIISLFIGLLFFSATRAQHCPYDGSYMIVAYLIDKDGNPSSSPAGLLLREKINPKADSCTYAPGQLMIPFKDASDSLLNKYNGFWKESARVRSKGADFMKKGYYVVVLNMSQHTCMVKQGPDFTYIPRQFSIEINGAGTDVTKESIYPLCTSAGDWKRIHAITVMTE
jgi:hypothetical protein